MFEFKIWKAIFFLALLAGVFSSCNLAGDESGEGSSSSVSLSSSSEGDFGSMSDAELRDLLEALREKNESAADTLQGQDGDGPLMSEDCSLLMEEATTQGDDEYAEIFLDYCLDEIVENNTVGSPDEVCLLRIGNFFEKAFRSWLEVASVCDDGAENVQVCMDFEKEMDSEVLALDGFGCAEFLADMGGDKNGLNNISCEDGSYLEYGPEGSDTAWCQPYPPDDPCIDSEGNWICEDPPQDLCYFDTSGFWVCDDPDAGCYYDEFGNRICDAPDGCGWDPWASRWDCIGASSYEYCYFDISRSWTCSPVVPVGFCRYDAVGNLECDPSYVPDPSGCFYEFDGLWTCPDALVDDPCYDTMGNYTC